jgi:hypothetical protein
LHIIISLVAGDVGKPVSSLTKVDHQKRQVKTKNDGVLINLNKTKQKKKIS